MCLVRDSQNDRYLTMISGSALSYPVSSLKFLYHNTASIKLSQKTVTSISKFSYFDSV